MRMRMLKKVIAVMLCGALAAGTSVCAFAEEKEYELYYGHDISGTTIDFWNYITGEDNECFMKWINKFNAENPYGVTINADSIAGDVLLEKLPPALASGTGPQMVMCGLDLKAYASQGLIQDLSPIFEITDLKREDFIDGLLDITSYEDGLYGLPFYVGVTFMFWNKDIYRQLGLDPDKNVKTWEELEEVCQMVKDQLGDGYYGLNFSYGLTYSIYDIMADFGGKIVTEDENGLYHNEIYSPENIEAMKFWQSFYDRGFNPQEAHDDLFYAGIVANAVSGPWLGGRARDEFGIDVGFGLAPGREDASYFYCASINMNITNNAKTEEEVLACYAWMEYWNSIEPCIDFSTTIHSPVYLKAALNDPRVTSNAELAAMSDFEGRTAWNWVPTSFTHGGEVNTLLGDMLEAVALGNDVEESLKKCSDYVDEVVERANQERIEEGKATPAE